MTLVLAAPGLPGRSEIFGFAQLSADPDNECAEFTLFVPRDIRGLGAEAMLMERIIGLARRRGIQQVTGELSLKTTRCGRVTLGFARAANGDDRHRAAQLRCIEAGTRDFARRHPGTYARSGTGGILPAMRREVSSAVRRPLSSRVRRQRFGHERRHHHPAEAVVPGCETTPPATAATTSSTTRRQRVIDTSKFYGRR